MKKIKLNSLPLGATGATDRIPFIQGSNLLLERRNNISTEKIFAINVASGIEHELLGTDTLYENFSYSSLLHIEYPSSGASALIILGMTVSQISIIGTAGSLSIGITPSGQEDILIYRKNTNGNVFIKNNTATSRNFYIKLF